MSSALTQTDSIPDEAGRTSVVTLPADIESISLLRSVLRVALDEYHWEDEPKFRVLLATTEAMANAVEHGSRDTGMVEVTYEVALVECVVRVVDGGGENEWQPSLVPPPPPWADERGRGLILIATHSDDVTISRCGCGTDLRMSFRRAA